MTSTSTGRLPLTGLRVVDMTELWAGPMAASYLADWGAEIIRVESYPRAETVRPLTGSPGALGFSHNDPMRPLPWERYARRFVSNHSKRGIALNVRDPRGHAVLLRLISVADVFLENYASDTISRLGLGYETVCAVNPRIIMVSLSGWGGGGPYAGYIAQGAGVDASVGHATVRGYAGDAPTEIELCYHSDAIGALAVEVATAAALHERSRSGHGRRVELSMAELLLSTLARSVIDASLNGRPGERMENDHYWQAPHGCYPARDPDRWLTIAVENDAQWQALCTFVVESGGPDLGNVPAYATVASRWEHRVALDEQLSGWTAVWDGIELMEALQERGVPAAAVYDEWDAMADPHLRERGFWLEVDHPIVERRTYPRIPWRLGDWEPAPYRAANDLGQDNRWVLQSLLGLPAAEVDELARDGVIGTSYA
jgi:crotonobetainyl-CoA:carnitine CoA-transferase CaiB-like acyl-CoA transferase